MSFDAKSHRQRHRKSRMWKQIKTGGVPLQQEAFGFAARIATLTRPDVQTQRRLEQEFRARERARAEEERAEQLEAMRRERPELLLCLEVAVPVWIERLRHQPFLYIKARANELAYVVACESDVFDRSAKPGQAARAFNAVAEGLAALSFGPGGVTWLGMHFEAVHPESPRASGQQETSP